MAKENRWAGMPPMMAQSQILTEMAQDMIESITGEWNQATYTIMLFGAHGSGSFEIVDAQGNSRKGRDRIAFNLSDELKRVMFVPGKGSWFSMVLTVRNSGSMEADFDYGTNPRLKNRFFSVSASGANNEQNKFPRDLEHQPQWYRELLTEYQVREQARLDRVAARDRSWASLGALGEYRRGYRMVTLVSGVTVFATDGYSNPVEEHPGEPGFELFMPSTLFTAGLDESREVWPFKAMNYLIGVTSDKDLDWPTLIADGLKSRTYVPNLANTTPADWRTENDDHEDVCGVLVGVRFPGVPDTLDGPDGPIRLIGVIPARPEEWQYLNSLDGSAEAASRVAAGLARLDPVVLASPDRPSVI